MKTIIGDKESRIMFQARLELVLHNRSLYCHLSLYGTGGFYKCCRYILIVFIEALQPYQVENRRFLLVIVPLLRYFLPCTTIMISGKQAF
jgi:hypothetical protein